MKHDHAIVRMLALGGIGLALAAWGCGGGGGGGSTRVAESDFYGTWIEVRDPAARGSRMAPVEPKTPNLRQLALKDDKTFTMTMVTPAGAPVSPPETVTGTWSFKDGTVLVTTQNNTLNAKYKDWDLTDISLMPAQASGGEKRLAASARDGSAAIFKIKG